MASEFCESEFWNANVTWHTTDPDFTSCFKQTVLVWLPCAFFWILAIIDVSHTETCTKENVPRGILNISKMLVTCASIALSIADLTVLIVHRGVRQFHAAALYTPVIQIVTFMLSAVLLERDRKYDKTISQSFFWFILLVCGLPQLRTQIRRAHEQSTDYDFYSYITFFSLAFVVWSLNCFPSRAVHDDKYSKSDRPCPERSASFVSRLLYTWVDPFLWRGFKNPLRISDLWNVNADETSKEIMPVFNTFWNLSVVKVSKKNSETEPAKVQKKRRQASILPVIWKSFGPLFIFGCIFKLISDLLIFVLPQILSLIIQFIETPSKNAVEIYANKTMLPISADQEPLWHGVFFAIGMFAVTSLQTLLRTRHLHYMSLIGQRIRTALTGAIYRKAMNLSNSVRNESTVGEIVNLIAVDAQRFMELTPIIDMLWSAPLQICLALYFLWNILGPSVLAGLAVILFVMPLNAFVARKQRGVQCSQMVNKDERIKTINELLNGIKVLKLYAWEPVFEKQVTEIRGKEIKLIRTFTILRSIVSFVWCCSPFLMALATFTTYLLTDEKNVLDSKTAFVSIALFNTLYLPLTRISFVVTGIIQTSVAVKRLNAFMNSDELDPQNVTHDESESAPLIIENGTFSWGEDKPTLRSINMRVNKNNLVAVVGSVGSGKSSLISAYLGEMQKISGRVNTIGTKAYVSQQAWIQNCTLQDNILFGKPMDRKRYTRVIAACALKSDLEMLPGGDQTEIGEKGINLSGGQKQRVSLARAVYNDADIYFFDDPLSAVDAHVGKHIFEKLLGPDGLLATKTRVLVTHAVTYLNEVDKVFVLKDGEISESGTMRDLIKKKGAFAEFLQQHIQDDEMEEMDNDQSRVSMRSQRSRALSVTEIANLNDGNYMGDEEERTLIGREKMEEGSVKWSVYKHYFANIGVTLTILAFVSNIGYHTFAFGTNVWLAQWSNDHASRTDPNAKFTNLKIYAAIGAAQVFFSPLVDFVPRLGCLVAAKTLHKTLLNGILHAPISFFDTTPVGRILTRFSKDIEALDTLLPLSVAEMIYYAFEVLATFIIISRSTYAFIFAIVPIAIIYYILQQIYVATSRQLNRLESVSRSPIYSHFAESIQGASTIRAYRVPKRFIVEFENKVDFNVACGYPVIMVNQWLAIRLEMLGNLIVLLAALFAVLSRNSIDAGTAGLSIVYALQVTQTLGWLIQMVSGVASNIVAVERIKEYGQTKQEAPWRLPNCHLSESWPENGVVQFKKLSVRYREGLDLVLRELTFDVQGGQKVGIVGRTGAGKSSLTLSLFRIVEPADGSISIDGHDITTLGLHTLRSKLTIIPQDPVLFSGSLRINLDPFGRSSDSEVWRALELAHLKSFVMGLNEGLHYEVSEGGENLSVGQRQLICLARALLRKTKVLILDEATAAIDLETDDLIQKTIRSEFKECTILTIAHRLNTILDSDKVLVLENGQILEFASPNDLLANRNSAFFSMAKDAGLVD